MISDVSNLHPATGSSTGQQISVTRCESGETPSESTNERGQLQSPDVSGYLPWGSLLLVPHGTGNLPVGNVAGMPVTDIKGYLEKRVAVATYELEQPLFQRLPLAERSSVRRLQSAVLFVRSLSTGKNAISVQKACERALAIYTEFRPLNTFRGKHDAWLKRQDWLWPGEIA